MAALSAHIAILVCLYAVIPFTPSAEAAHIYGGHLRASSPHSPQRSYDPSFGQSTFGYEHDNKNHGHRTRDYHAVELPPLLRRYHVHDRKKNNEGQDHRDHARDGVPRSAFARSRYRRESGTRIPRSSVYVPGEHGDTYLVSRAVLSDWDHGYAATDKESSHIYTSRQVDESNLAFGRIDILSAQSSGGSQRLASLSVDSTPIDWTSGQTSAKAFPLNASTANQTQFIMIPTDGSNGAGSPNKHVALATEVFDADSAEMVMYCATYDPDPGQASALLMTPCTGTTRPASPPDDLADPCVNEDGSSSSNPHQSQIFSYDPSSGKIEPISAAGNATAVGSGSNTSTQCVGAKVRRDSINSTNSNSARPSITSTSVAPTASAFQQAQNVTLVYVAGALEVPAASSSPSVATAITNATTTATTGASIGQAAVFTTTITTTVVATVMSTSRSPTPARAVESVSTPSPPSTILTPSVSTTTTQSSSSLSTTTSPTSTSTMLAPAKAEESLEVEVVGVASSTSGTPSSTSTTQMTTSSYVSATGFPSSTLDAAAIASSVANQMPHRRIR